MGALAAQAIRNHQIAINRNLKREDFETAIPAAYPWLGQIKQLRPAAGSDAAIAGYMAGSPQTVIEYDNGVKLIINTPPENLAPGGDGIKGDAIVGHDYVPKAGKSPTLEAAEIKQAEASARLAKANAERQETLNAGGIPTREAEQNIKTAQAQEAQAAANTRKIDADLASGKTEAEVAQIYSNMGSNTSQAQSAAENAATGRGRLILEATTAEIERRYKEGLIDNETRRILTNHAWQRWQADNQNTQTVVGAAGKVLEGELTQRNQNIALDNTRTNAANQGFSDDTRTVTTMAQFIDPAVAENVIYNGLVGLAGLRKGTVKDWGGLRDHPEVAMPGVLQQLGRNTPVVLQSMPTMEEVEQERKRIANGLGTQPVTVPNVAPTPIPVVSPKPVVIPTTPARPAAPAPVARPSQATPPGARTGGLSDSDQEEMDRANRQSTLAPVVAAPPSQSHIVSNNLLGYSMQPVTYAQGGTPIAVLDLFSGRTRPTRERYAWLR